jgi:hypothetical protein
LVKSGIFIPLFFVREYSFIAARGVGTWILQKRFMLLRQVDENHLKRGEENEKILISDIFFGAGHDLYSLFIRI